MVHGVDTTIMMVFIHQSAGHESTDYQSMIQVRRSVLSYRGVDMGPPLNKQHMMDAAYSVSDKSIE